VTPARCFGTSFVSRDTLASEVSVSFLRSWILRGAGSSQPSLPDLDPALVFDDGIFCITTDAIETLAQGEPFTNVRIITEVLAESSVCIVAEGTDPVTNLRHRQSWVFEFTAGKISRIVLTSAPIPEQPHDGRLSLGSVAG